MKEGTVGREDRDVKVVMKQLACVSECVCVCVCARARVCGCVCVCVCVLTQQGESLRDLELEAISNTP